MSRKRVSDLFDPAAEQKQQKMIARLLRDRGVTDLEEKEFLADAMRWFDWPYAVLEVQVRKRFELEDKNRRRQAGIVATNDARRRKARSDHRLYREIAEGLITRNPILGRSSRNRLAKRVQEELVTQGRGLVSARTIWEALWPKNKV
jgi:hypothetical protein